MTKNETITPNELQKILNLSTSLDLLLLCTINDNIIKIGIYDSWKIKIYECSQNDKRLIFDMINNHYRTRNQQ